jgi:hypothetical protein
MKELTVARFIPALQATSAADFPFALRSTVCGRITGMIFPDANTFSMSALSSGPMFSTKLFIRPL